MCYFVIGNNIVAEGLKHWLVQKMHKQKLGSRPNAKNL